MSDLAQKLLDSVEWINNDTAYKAPEQVTVALLAEYVDKLMGDVKEAAERLRKLEAVRDAAIPVAENVTPENWCELQRALADCGDE